MPTWITCIIIFLLSSSLAVKFASGEEEFYLAVAISTDGDAYGFGLSYLPAKAAALAIKECTKRVENPTDHCISSLLCDKDKCNDKCIAVYKETKGSESEIDFATAKTRRDVGAEINWSCQISKADKCTLIEARCIP